MSLLIAGIILWSLVHFIPAFPGIRGALTTRLGTFPYKGLFSLLIVGSIVLMVWGWKSTRYTPLYTPPDWGSWAAIAVMFAASVLFFGARIPSALNRVLRHPQLTGVCLFGIAHLLANGDRRSLVLFGGLALWAIVDMVLINRREGPWVRPPADAPTHTVRLLIVGTVFFIVFAVLHPWLFGVGPLMSVQLG